ncbi:MAG: NAD(P)H-dependent oxidoreductase subunit E [Gammaproteobacteria bacterium]|nr:NAD(P)H-dependent oxidoreductase subunit E [Gammaproteobacteria bacterium]
MNSEVQTILDRYNSDKTRLMDILWDVQNAQGFLSDEAIASMAEGLNMSGYDVRETLTFYHFFHDKPFGKHKIFLSDTVIARVNGYDEVHDALEAATGCSFGGVDSSGTFGLGHAPCIGLSEQEPAMMVDEVVFTNLTAAKVNDIVGQLKSGKSAADIAAPGQASTTIGYVDAIVTAEVHKGGTVMFKDGIDYKAVLQAAIDKKPAGVVDVVKAANLRGRGGAGFPTGLKWGLCSEAEGAEKYVICNADEGEPGTFKDRVLLTRSPKDVLVGMAVAAYAIGSRNGILYLRAEYRYLKDFLNQQIQDLRDAGLLGKGILGAFDFDIRIVIGGGAYICGDETSLIESCEGKRGSPRVKPPYPVQQGYLGMPTAVNNVETYAIATRVIEKGSDWFTAMGTKDSPGTRLLSVSGDCDKPGVYEIEWGTSLNEVLAMVGASNAKAAQISGPAGECLSVAKDGDRIFCYSDLSCNGSLMIFNQSRNLLDVVKHFMDFFVEESCGICVPCRAGGVDMRDKIDLVIAGRATQQDLDEIQSWGNLLKASRCALGTTSPKPLLTTLDKFPEIYAEKIVVQEGALLASFDIEEAGAANKRLLKKFMGVNA